ncbi:molybdopterin molybdotransferase [Roseimicrobium gellanilyticum]|uniref:Molybdopterin molybdenumtransferase n=1 Tax=Roseimicrobium gellanilyticum TaxID=748857 RepID=A0A366HTQ6_9BACT|nr:gephyrin-like molybdotransferase Glp [Roseimicrobium gellanilyticum]RBP46087.1 molybdopterin molybdotransferase [Roseimicrobium gellanilyticum]
MLTEQEALEHILSSVTALPSQSVPLREGVRSYAARAIHATIPLPGFDNSAMDGYAVRAEDTRTTEPLRVTGAIAAGDVAGVSLEPHTAIRIFTGAPMPPGADAVIMQEDVSTDAEKKSIVCKEPVELGENVRVLGCDLCVGQRIVDKGEPLNAARLAVLASQGLTHVDIAEAPRIAVVTTGDELIPPGEPLLPGKLYNSNGIMLEAMLRSVGISSPITFHHLRDNLEETVSALRELTRQHDFIILSGGVSVGEHDYIKPALKALDIPAEFWRVKVKPGKPVLFAKTVSSPRPCHLFGLPGNPVSSHVTFHLFVRPALLKVLGAGNASRSLPRVSATLTRAMKNRGDRPHYIRGVHEDGKFTPTGVQQSHALFSLSRANAFLRMDPEQELAEGATVQALLCD